MIRLMNNEINITNEKRITNKIKNITYKAIRKSLSQKVMNEILLDCYDYNLSENEIKELYNRIDNLFNEKSLK